MSLFEKQRAPWQVRASRLLKTSAVLMVGCFLGATTLLAFDGNHKALEAIRAVTDKPVQYAFQSHNHWDHASGGQVFTAAGARHRGATVHSGSA